MAVRNSINGIGDRYMRLKPLLNGALHKASLCQCRSATRWGRCLAAWTRGFASPVYEGDWESKAFRSSRARLEESPVVRRRSAPKGLRLCVATTKETSVNGATAPSSLSGTGDASRLVYIAFYLLRSQLNPN